MARPIDHDFGSATTTTAFSALKGGLIGAVVAAAVGGLIFAGVAAAAGALFAGGAAAAFTGTFGVATTVGIVASSLASLLGFGTVSTVAGGVVGALTGARKVHSENSAFRTKAMGAGRMQEMGQSQAATVGMQQGYMIGAQEGYARGGADKEEQMVNDLRQAHDQIMMATALQAHGGHTAKVCKDRDMQAVAVKQM